MLQTIKQVVGIDVAQNELVVSMGRMRSDWTPEAFASKSFANNKTGFAALLKWVASHQEPQCPVRYVMEATGVYHESLAYFLHEQGCELSIVLPTKISNYHRTLEVKTITDKTSAQTITRFGLERKLDQWHKPDPMYKRMRQLTREREQVIAARTVAKNQLHAERAEAEPGKKTVERLKKQIVLFNAQEKEIATEIRTLIKGQENISHAMKLLTTITGIGDMTAAAVLAETNGFELIRSKRQLTSYAGLDVREKQSGTSIKGKAKISKKGNVHLRKAMHMPALTAVRYDARFKAVFERLVARHGIKMKAYVAIQRKLLEMTYTIFKTQQVYQKNYCSQKEQPTAA